MARGVETLLSNPHLSKRTGEAGFERVRANFAVDKNRRILEQLYNHLIVGQ